MKKIIFCFATIAVMAVGCQKETIKPISSKSKEGEVSLKNLSQEKNGITIISETRALIYNIVSKELTIEEHNRNDRRFRNKDFKIERLNYQFSFDKDMPNFDSKEELISFIENNRDEVNAKLEVFLGNRLVYSAQIENGQRINVGNELGIGVGAETPLAADDCNYKAIRKCAIDRIHNQNWFDMTLCVIKGFECVVEKYASCIVDLCDL